MYVLTKDDAIYKLRQQLRRYSLPEMDRRIYFEMLRMVETDDVEVAMDVTGQLRFRVVPEILTEGAGI